MNEAHCAMRSYAISFWKLWIRSKNKDVNPYVWFFFDAMKELLERWYQSFVQLSKIICEHIRINFSKKNKEEMDHSKQRGANSITVL